MQEGGRKLKAVLDKLVELVEPGRPTNFFDKKARQLIKKAGGRPSFLGYRGYPAAVCASINEQIVHAPPSGRELKKGDIFTIDIAMHYPPNGLAVDTAITLPVAEISPQGRKLLSVTLGSLKAAIAALRPGLTTGQVGAIIQNHIEKGGFSVIKPLIGHGIGYKLHEAPAVPNFKMPGANFKLYPGMTIAIEPMASAGQGEIKKGKDGLSYETIDGSLSAHFEHTVFITESKAKVLTDS